LISASTATKTGHVYLRSVDNMKLTARQSMLILHVASYLNQVKGTKFCIEALSKAIRIFPDFQLLVFNAHNNTKKQQELYEYARLLNAENNIKFKPFVEESEMPKYYSAAKFVLQPSMPATTLMSIHEGACCEIPAIAFDCGAASEDIAHEETGLLVQPYDTDALSKAMIRLHSFVESDRMGKAARKRSSLLFNWDIEYQKLLRIIETC